MLVYLSTHHLKIRRDGSGQDTLPIVAISVCHHLIILSSVSSSRKRVKPSAANLQKSLVYIFIPRYVVVHVYNNVQVLKIAMICLHLAEKQFPSTPAKNFIANFFRTRAP